MTRSVESRPSFCGGSTEDAIRISRYNCVPPTQLGYLSGTLDPVRFHQAICEQLRSCGYWADYIDPCSGLPMLTVGLSSLNLRTTPYVPPGHSRRQHRPSPPPPPPPSPQPNCNKVYSEVDGMQMLMHYPVMNAAMCKILLHPKWGSSVYPATVFTDAPYSAVAQLLEVGEKWLDTLPPP